MGDNINKPHCCPHQGCKSSFNRPYRLAQHLLVHNNVKAYACPEENCSKSYCSKSHLDRHIKSVHRDPEKDFIYSCPTCLKKYANRQNLKRHIKIHHTLKVPFSCDMCKLEFHKKNQLSAHMYEHTGIKSFSCEICSKEFVSLFDKKRHIRIHKTHQCDICLMNFSHWSKYQKHIKTEHVTSEYICNECKRSFKKRCHIVRHVKIHDSSKVFPCPYENCKRYYSRNSNLKQHILMKHKQMAFKCPTCEALLSTKAKLYEHMLKIHTGNESKTIKQKKTKAMGRKLRKDAGVPKVAMAIKLAGLLEQAAESSENNPNKLIKVTI